LALLSELVACVFWLGAGVFFSVKLAFSTNAYTRFSLPEALRGIRRAGFLGVEILADVPHAYPASITDSQIGSVVDVLGRVGLSVSNVNVNCSFGYWKDGPPEAYFEPSLISPNERHRRDRIELIGKAMEFARGVGARNISITSGRMLGNMSPLRAAKQLEESLALVLELADRFEMNVGIECEPGLFIEYVAELREWIDRVGHPRLGANLDIGHSQVIGESIPAAIELLGDRIWNLHVEDIPGRKHYHMIPGEGSIDWLGVRDALRRVGYERYLTVELYTQTDDPQSAAEKSFGFLEKVFNG
jgi:sugar phosphate isomerase/epimerase